MSFFNQEFPRAISFLAQGGPVFSTTVNEGFSGGEQRNRNWSRTRGEWTIDLAFKDQAFFDLAHAFFLCVGGQADSFRFFDHKDNQATNEIIGYGDGTTTSFQLIKTYVSGSRSYVRNITNPIQATVMDFQNNPLTNTVVVRVGNTLQSLTTNYTVNDSTGLVSFVTPPSAGSPPPVITASCQFHFPVRFMTDALKAQMEESDVLDGAAVISWPTFDLRECKQY